MALKLKIKPQRAYGHEREQSWFFINGGRKDPNAYLRWVVVRQYCANGDIWWGVRANWADTHEDAILDGRIEQEMDMAADAIEILKKDWQKHLQF